METLMVKKGTIREPDLVRPLQNIYLIIWLSIFSFFEMRSIVKILEEPF